MTPSPDLARRLAKVAPRLEELRSLSDRDLIAAARTFTPFQRDLAIRVSYSPASLSRALATDPNLHRSLSPTIRERIAVFAALEGKRVPKPAPLAARWPYDATQDRSSIRLLKPEADRLAWLGTMHKGGLAGAVREALALYVKVPHGRQPPAPPRWPSGVDRVPCPMPEKLLAKIEVFDPEPIVFARHLRVAILAWMVTQPAGPPHRRAIRANALLKKLKPGTLIGVSETVAITGANTSVSRQLLRRLAEQGALEKVKRGRWRRSATGTSSGGPS